MIELIDVSKYYPTELGRHYVFRNVSLTLPLNINVAVIGPNGAGKSTFLRMLGGADTPSEGRIVKSGSISPPMGLTPGLQATMTGGENTRFACRIYGMTRDEADQTVERVRELADVGKFFDLPVRTYSAGMKQRVSFALSMSMHFDYYLFDEISAGGDRAFRKTSKRLIQDRLATSNFIIATHRTDEMLELCQACILIRNGELTYYDDIRAAIEAYGVDDEDEETAAKLADIRRRRRGLDGPIEQKAEAAHPAEAERHNGVRPKAPRAGIGMAVELQEQAAAKAARALVLLMRLVDQGQPDRALAQAAAGAQRLAAAAAMKSWRQLAIVSIPEKPVAAHRQAPARPAPARPGTAAMGPSREALRERRRKRFEQPTSSH